MSSTDTGNQDEKASRLRDASLQRLGRYRFLFEIGRGGMAEVFLAVMEGPAQFNKLIAVKVLRDAFNDQADGREMFVNEARLAARLSHPNVVSVHEVGENDGHLFIAMEYLKGQPFSRILSCLREANHPKFTLEMQLFILSETLSGLQHAHECADFDGTPLHLVHRDVTPHNIFVTYDGSVKVLDFGIAKSVSNSAATQAGIIKGKVGFMAPEQLMEGSNLDRRADIYSVGCCLWETIAGRRPFKGLADVALLTKVATTGVPAIRSAVPDIHPELERICNKAVAYNRDDRYSTASEFQNDLDAFILARSGRVQSREVGQQLSELFQQTREETQRVIKDRLSEVKFASTGEFAPSANLGTAQSGSWSGSGNTGKTTAPSVLVGNGEPQPFQGSSRGKMVALALGGVVAIALLGALLGRWSGAAAKTSNSSEPLASVKVKLSAFPATSRLLLDGAGIATNPIEMSFRKDGSKHLLSAEATGYAGRSEEFVADGDRELRLVLEPLPVELAPSATPEKQADKPPAVRNVGAHPAAVSRGNSGKNTASDPPAQPKAGPDCTNPYYVNSSGIKSIRPECL